MTYHYCCHDCAMCEDVTESLLEAKSQVQWHRAKSGHSVEYAEVESHG